MSLWNGERKAVVKGPIALENKEKKNRDEADQFICADITDNDDSFFPR